MKDCTQLNTLFITVYYEIIHDDSCDRKYKLVVFGVSVDFFYSIDNI